jgi:hypothetical protein
MTRPFVACTEDPAHVAQCQDCRLAGRFRHLFRDSEGARAEDELLIARAVDKALRRRTRTRHVDGRVMAVAAALLLFAAGMASGSLLVHWRGSAEADADDDAEITVVKRRHHHARGGRHGGPGTAAVPDTEGPEPAEPAAAEPPVAASPALGSTEVEPAVPPQEEPSRGSTAVSPALSLPAHGQEGEARPPRRMTRARPKVDATSPAELFRQGLTARGGGNTAAAISTFRALEKRFPESAEAIVSYVSLGTLLLERGEPVAAVAAFNDYLQAAPYGDLVREALAGKRRALEAAGLPDETAAANRELERRFPSGRSGDADRAP